MRKLLLLFTLILAIGMTATAGNVIVRGGGKTRDHPPLLNMCVLTHSERTERLFQGFLLSSHTINPVLQKQKMSTVMKTIFPTSLILMTLPSTSVQALDRIDTYKGMTIENGGALTLECDGTVYLHGGLVKKGGKLTVKAPDVVFGSDFTVDKGGILDIVNK